MLGLIFVTWEKFLAEQFDASVLQAYRTSIGDANRKAPLTTHVYHDDLWQQGVQQVSQLTRESEELLLRRFGHYFITNGLTRHQCAYLLTQATCARDLVLLMRQAHIQMAAGPDGLTPPVFTYEFLTTDKNRLLLTYASPRHLCGWLWGAVEGAADYFSEHVAVQQRACVMRGASNCLFEVQFFTPSQNTLSSPGQTQAKTEDRTLARLVLSSLPSQQEQGLTIFELQTQLQASAPGIPRLRPSVLLEILQRLQHAGLLASTANRPDDDLGNRRYWRVQVVSDISLWG